MGTTSNYGLLNGLAVRAPDQSKYVLAAYQKKQAEKVAQQKADDAMMKSLNDFISNESKDIHPVYKDDAQRATTQLAANYLKGKAQDPNYKNSVGFMQDKAAFQAEVGLYRRYSDNIRRTEDFALAHPNDYQKNPKLWDALYSGNASKFHAVNQELGNPNNGFDVGYGLQEVPNWDLLTKSVVENSKLAPPVPEKIGSKDNTNFYQTYTPIDRNKATELAHQLALTHDYGMGQQQFVDELLKRVPEKINFVNSTAAVYHPPQGSAGITLNNGAYTGKGNSNAVISEDDKYTYIQLGHKDNVPEKEYFTTKLKNGEEVKYVNPQVKIDKADGTIQISGDKYVLQDNGTGGAIKMEWTPLGKGSVVVDNTVKKATMKGLETSFGQMFKYHDDGSVTLNADNNPNTSYGEDKRSSKSTPTAPKAVKTAAKSNVIYSKSKSGKDIYSDDGGKTWNYK